MNNKDSKIFPDFLIASSVRNQGELDAVFLKYYNYSKTYIKTALYSYWQNDRKWYEKNWPRVRTYLDKNFLSEFQKENSHNARAWEFYLATVFIDRGFKLLQKTWKKGPDFCIKMTTEKNIWIDAVACDDGEIHVKQYQHGCHQYGIEEMQHNRVLRITGALWKKFKKFNDDLNDSKSEVKISNKDCLVVAISGANIQDKSDGQALFERAMFARGLDAYYKTPGHEGFQRGYSPAPPVTRFKKGNDSVEEIKTEPMVMDEFSKISAVLYSGYSVGHSSWSGIGDEFLFAYHSKPDNPIPEKFFNFGLGIRKNSISGEITGQKQM